MAVLFVGACAASAGDPPATIADGDAALQRLDLEKGLALPTAWVTDDYYRALARSSLARVQDHLE